MEFQRARSDEQRQQRRAVILATAAAMLTEMPVAQLSLNELSRRVGLAKSNVLRYFESREAVLLELLDGQLRGFADELAADFELVGVVRAVDAAAKGRGPSGSAPHRARALAEALAASLERRPGLCDLLSTQAGVLERNVTTEVVLRHKRATAITVQVLVDVVHRHLPELSAASAHQVVGAMVLLTAGAWPYARPSEALVAAYVVDPSIAAPRSGFTGMVTGNLALVMLGLLTEVSS